MQRGEARQQMDELAARRRWRSWGFNFVPSPHWRGAGRGHGVDHQWSPWRGVAEMPLAGRRRQGMMTEVQGWEQPCAGAVDSQSIGV